MINRNSTPSQEEIDRLRADLLGDREIHPYLAFGLGYRHDAGRPLGLVVMHYLDGDIAVADLEARRALASEGESLVTGQPYRDGLFTVEDATVEGSDLLLNVRLIDDKPRRLFDMFFRRDMAFAACP